MSISNNIEIIREKIRASEQKYGRASGSVNLLAASKSQPIEKIIETLKVGQRLFGENYLQEALLKIKALSQYDIEWHFIGHLQANKTRKIAENFSWVHSVSSIHIARRLSDQRPETLPPLNICLEINIDEEPLKSGILVKDALVLAEYCYTLPRLKLRGLMAIPLPRKEFTEQRAAFRKVRNLLDALNEKKLNLDTLSMGMTDDMEAAIAEGSNIVRVGTGIFGQRI